MLVLLLSIFIKIAFANTTKCPELQLPLNETPKFFQPNPTLDCRASCKLNTDCIIETDPCGRPIAINSQFKKEINEAFKKQDPNKCLTKIALPFIEKAQCKNKRCQIAKVSCNTARNQLEKYTNESFHGQCKADKDCSYILMPNGNCFDYLPLNIQGMNRSKEIEFNYLKERVLFSCGVSKPTFCEKKPASQCIARTCIQLAKPIQYKPFLNFEGPEQKANYNSKTEPYMTPELNEISCKNKLECRSLMGICGQYAVAINKDSYSDFKNRLMKTETTISCPTPGVALAPDSDCVNNYCVFKEN